MRYRPEFLTDVLRYNPLSYLVDPGLKVLLEQNRTKPEINLIILPWKETLRLYRIYFMRNEK